METQIRIVGLLMVMIAIVHVVFPSYFKWKTELASLSLINRQLMYVHSFFIAITVLLMGLLCLSSPAELLHTTLGKKLLAGLGFFWLLRLVFQFIGYSQKNWRGKPFETVVHVLFCFLWAYITFVFVLASAIRPV